MFRQYGQNKELLLKSIEKSIFNEDLTYSKRQQIHNTLKSLVTNLSQISNVQYKYNAPNPNAASIAQAIISAIINLTDFVESGKLQERLKGFGDYISETKELSRIKNAYNKLVKEIENANELNSKIQNTHENFVKWTDSLSKSIKELELEKTRLKISIHILRVFLIQ